MSEIKYLDWPTEFAGQKKQSTYKWLQAGSNIVLDFHGDPVAAGLTVLADGNHHMALEEVLRRFIEVESSVNEIFYVTLPPAVLLNIIEQKQVCLGSLILPVQPNLVLGPRGLMDELAQTEHVSNFKPFVKNRGSVLLVEKGNTRKITGVEDLFRDDVRLFISNPETEKVSYSGYRDTLVNMAKKKGLQSDVLAGLLEHGAAERVVYGSSVHHREAPHSLINNLSDVAVVYYHLALRYTRIFPDKFEIIPLGGSVDVPEPAPENVVTTIYMAMFAHGGEWGERLYTFLQTPAVKEIYEYHGLDPT